ncbi:MAG: hypothetical protein RLZZ142_2811 [Verrucomicrobiota bacterium]|jgi:dTMP kinase
MQKNVRILGGLLVVVEGVDGAGKSTVLKRLADWCAERSLDFVLSREPTDGPWGRRIRESAVVGRLSLEEELELFLQDRREHVQNLIRPALDRGAVVLLDRYYFSNAAYQGARGADPESVLRRNECFAPAPDLVLLLDCDPRVTLERVRQRGGGVDEFERLDALERVREIFLKIRRPGVEVVSAEEGPETVGAVCERLLEKAVEAKAGGLE